MTAKLTDKQEKFCQLYVRYGNATKAYFEAYSIERDRYDQSVGVDACKLLKREHVRARVDELKEELKDEFLISIEVLLRELEDARQLAMDDPKGAAAAVAAVNAKAKLVGLSVDKHEHSGPGGKPIETKSTIDVTTLTDEQLAALLEIVKSQA